MMGKILLIVSGFFLVYSYWCLDKAFSVDKTDKRLNFYGTAAFIIGTIIAFVGVSLM